MSDLMVHSTRNSVSLLTEVVFTAKSPEGMRVRLGKLSLPPWAVPLIAAWFEPPYTPAGPRGAPMAADGEEVGEPTVADMERACGWLAAMEGQADMWTRLRPDQQDMVRRRVAWALGLTVDDLSEVSLTGRTNPQEGG